MCINALPLDRSASYPSLHVNTPRDVLGLVGTVASKIYELTLRFFSLGSNLFLVGFGVKELFLDFFSLRARLKRKRRQEQSSHVDIVADRSLHHLKKVQNLSVEYSLAHGALYLGSGVFGGLASLHDLKWLDLGKTVPFARHLGSGLFIFVNLYSLQQNIKLFYHAQKMSKSDNGELRSFANRLKASAVLGMINNIGYILATRAAFLPATLAIAIALACLAFSVGSLKILYDFFFVSPKFSKFI